MIIVLSSTAAPALSDLDRFDRLHAELHGDLADAQLGELCRRGGDDDVWLDVTAARSAGAAASSDPSFTEQFDAMIAYASGKGWLNDEATHVRAHIESTDSSTD